MRHKFAMIYQLGLSLIVLGIPSMSACVGCEPVDVPSIVLTVIDAESGEPIPDLVVSYSIDGDMPRWVEHPGEDAIPLSGPPGLYQVDIEADGYEPVVAEWDVAERRGGRDQYGHCSETLTEEHTVELVPLE